ncbi:universal stress protein [Paractinoplanes lichenicola]|uniref:Universal stress protein n=1 Tax=Paractinoplanes lichenicola TaxID=2802976 RepID=A0ABS1VVZ8_9ACTN|nr:universal stress protein [Actinoplanes lichenicola]MBL7258646.1 universal stress protein [Actinoplanes lichenicola]
MTTNGIVVGVDGSAESLAAVRWAGRYAGEIGAPLQVIHAAASPETVSMMLPVPVGISTAGLRRGGPTAPDVVRTAGDEASRSNPPPEISSLTVPAEPVSALVEASSGAGLVVLGASHRRRFAATLSGSVSGRVVAAAHCPVVVVREDVDPSGPVVVAVDSEGTSEAAVRFAFAEAARRGCALHAVHAWQVPSMPSGTGSTAVMTNTRYLPDAALRALSAAVAPGRAAFPGVEVHERLLTGSPQQVVPGETDGAALVVVGSRGRAPLTGLLLGSTSQELLHRSSTPVAVVRAPEEGAGLPADASLGSADDRGL